jgi:hypothetical protein
VDFIPPSDWGFKAFPFDSSVWPKSYRVALICSTQAPVQNDGFYHGPVVWSVRREQYIPMWKPYVEIPGWNPANDVNGDGFVSNAEYAALVDTSARARLKSESRVPSFPNSGGSTQRWCANVADTTYRRLTANWYKWMCQQNRGSGSVLAGIAEDNCIPNDGSLIVTQGSWNLADSAFAGNYTFADTTQRGQVLEYGASKRGPGRLYTIDHLGADSVAYTALKSIGKFYEGNPSQYWADMSPVSRGEQAPYTVNTWTAFGSAGCCDSSGYFAYKWHNSSYREFMVIPNTQCWACTLSNHVGDAAVYETPYQWRKIKESSDNKRSMNIQIRQSVKDSCCVADTASEYTWNGQTVSRDRDRMFGLAYAYCAQHDSIYFNWVPVGGTQGSTAQESLSWWPAVHVDIGTALDDTAFIWATGNDAGNAPYRIYCRRYSRGLPRGALRDTNYVFVKTKANTGDPIGFWNSPTTHLPIHNTPKDGRKYRRLRYDGSYGAPDDSIRMQNCEGVIMIDTLYTTVLACTSVVTVNAPNGNATWFIGLNHGIAFSTDACGVNAVGGDVSMRCSYNGIVGPYVVLSQMDSTTVADGIWSAKISNIVPCDADVVRVRVWDRAGNIGSGVSAAFKSRWIVPPRGDIDPVRLPGGR